MNTKIDVDLATWVEQIDLNEQNIEHTNLSNVTELNKTGNLMNFSEPKTEYTKNIIISLQPMSLDLCFEIMNKNETYLAASPTKTPQLVLIEETRSSGSLINSDAVKNSDGEIIEEVTKSKFKSNSEINLRKQTQLKNLQNSIKTLSVAIPKNIDSRHNNKNHVNLINETVDHLIENCPQGKILTKEAKLCEVSVTNKINSSPRIQDLEKTRGKVLNNFSTFHSILFSDL